MRIWLWPLALLLGLTVCLPPTMSQASDFRIRAGYALRADNGEGVISSWDNKAALVLGLSHKVRPGTAIGARLTFRRGTFVEYNGEPSFFFPGVHTTPYIGDALWAVEATPGVEFEGVPALDSSGDRRIRLTGSVYGGAVIASLGRVSRYIWRQDSPGRLMFETAKGTGTVTIRPLLGIEMGAVFPIGRIMGVGASVGFWVTPRRHMQEYELWRQLTLFVEYERR